MQKPYKIYFFSRTYRASSHYQSFFIHQLMHKRIVSSEMV